MRFIGLFPTLLVTFATLQAGPTNPSILAPIRFEPNRGQVRTTAREPVEWVARGIDYSYLFTRDAAILHFDQHSYRMRFAGANISSRLEGSGPIASTTQYLTPSFTETLHGYQRLVRKDVYPGIDLIFYGNGQHLEYDFEVAPGADPSKIRFRFEGTGNVRLDDKGDLVLGSAEHALTQRAPVVFQQNKAGQRVPIPAEYKLDQNGWISVALGNYDRSSRLLIDPELIYTAYLFGTKTDTAVAVAHDNQGFVYVAGNTLSTDFTVTDDNYALNVGGQDVWFTKMNPKATDGTFMVYSTYYGGGTTDTLRAMAVDPVSGKVYLTGITTSSNLPLAGAYQSSNTGNDLFVAAFDPAQSGTAGLVYATYLGGVGNEDVRAIAQKDAKVYIFGNTKATTYPTVNAIATQPTAAYDLILSIIDTTQTGSASLVYSTYLNAGAEDYARSIALDPNGKVYLAGLTYSTDFPVTADGYQTVYKPGGEIFVIKLDLTTNTIAWGTYFGGSNLDDPKKMVIEPSGRIALTGFTMSSDYPITQTAYQPLLNGTANAFLTILDPSKQGLDSLAYSTYFGGGEADVAYDLALDIQGKYYFAGYTLSGRADSTYPFPVTNDALYQVSAQAGTDGFLAVIDPNAPSINSLIYSTYITSKGTQIVYALDVDIMNTAYIVGTSTSDIFPAGLAQRETKPGNIDGFVAAFQFPPPPQELLDALAAEAKAAEEAKNAAAAAAAAATDTAASDASAATDAGQTESAQ